MDRIRKFRAKKKFEIKNLISNTIMDIVNKVGNLKIIELKIKNYLSLMIKFLI